MAEKADPKTISGMSDVLGACRADLADVDQLLFGTFIEQSAAQLAYHLWKLHHATEPKFAQAEADASADGRLTGIESPLVGQPAPVFKLDLLNGSPFQLADHKGKGKRPYLPADANLKAGRDLIVASESAMRYEWNEAPGTQPIGRWTDPFPRSDDFATDTNPKVAD